MSEYNPQEASGYVNPQYPLYFPGFNYNSGQIFYNGYGNYNLPISNSRSAPPDVTHSRLTPTAQEFSPRNDGTLNTVMVRNPTLTAQEFSPRNDGTLNTVMVKKPTLTAQEFSPRNDGTLNTVSIKKPSVTAQEFTPRNDGTLNTGSVKKKPVDRNKRWENRRSYRQPDRQYGHSSRETSEYTEPDISLKSTGVILESSAKGSRNDSSRNNLTEGFGKLSVTGKHNKQYTSEKLDTSLKGTTVANVKESVKSLLYHPSKSDSLEELGNLSTTIEKGSIADSNESPSESHRSGNDSSNNKYEQKYQNFTRDRRNLNDYQINRNRRYDGASRYENKDYQINKNRRYEGDNRYDEKICQVNKSRRYDRDNRYHEKEYQVNKSRRHDGDNRYDEKDHQVNNSRRYDGDNRYDEKDHQVNKSRRYDGDNRYDEKDHQVNKSRRHEGDNRYDEKDHQGNSRRYDGDSRFDEKDHQVNKSRRYDSDPRYDEKDHQVNKNRRYEGDSGYDEKNMYYRNSDRNSYKGRDNFHGNWRGCKNNFSYNQGYDRVDRTNRFYDRTEKSKDYNAETNWRSSSSRDNTSKKSQMVSQRDRKKKIDAASQRERLVDMIETRILECLVCCEKVKNSDKIWSCIQCYHILHLSCTIAWAKSSKLDSGWRCPACQNVCTEVPKVYKCYCGKVTDPKNEPGVTAHSCGELCMRKGRTCDHKCVILCHPGPCPDCNVMVERYCGCGATKQTIKCSSDVEILCEAVCNKLLECTVHTCKSKCHSGPCGPCEQFIEQECYCGKVARRVPCSAEHRGQTRYKCGEVCEKTLSCGNHKCDKLCHDGPCDKCPRDVALVKTCPCGKKTLEKERTSCLDPIPTCGETCGKKLKCGQPSSPHACKAICHEGDCPPCPLTTLVRCRCGHMDKELPCPTLTTKADDARCEKKCTKKRLCGKHRCNQQCCIEIEHICPLPCNHLLNCGQHRCDKTCHKGKCPPCMEASFNELYCECGASVLFPPIPCGTKPPSCSNPCIRPRACGHEANHNCHTGPCPPCTVLCKRWCYGKHEERSAIPCYQENFSCGLPCNKLMPCGRHRCIKPCHLGECPLPCKQPCTVERSLCGHPCNAPCHDPPCPETACKHVVTVTCSCGLQKSTRPCTELTEEFRNIEMAQLKDKMADKDQPVDITDILNKPKKPSILKILECNDECKVLERNRRLAIGLQIRNPDLSQKLTPRYSDFMRSWAKKDSHFCQRIHNKLTELVQLAKQSKQKSRSFSFESVNRDKRHFIHEYCEHFGCESAAYDMEPNRNVVATAFKEKSWLPSMSLLEVIQRENGQRKVPGPIMTKGTPGKSESVSLKLPSRSQRPATPPGEYVDYFDDPGV